jgi:hypothetical protein
VVRRTLEAFRAGGIDAALEFIRDGTSHQAHFFESWQEALEAAGLSE